MRKYAFRFFALSIVAVVFGAYYLSNSESGSLQAEEMNLFSSGQERVGQRSNPELSLWQRFLCVGHKKALGCPDIPLHPTEEAKRMLGMKTTVGKTPKRSVTMNLEDIIR